MLQTTDFDVGSVSGNAFILSDISQRESAATEGAEQGQIVVPVLTEELIDAVPWPSAKEAERYSLKCDQILHIMRLVRDSLPLLWRMELIINFDVPEDRRRCRRGGQLACIWVNLHAPEGCGLPEYTIENHRTGFRAVVSIRDDYGIDTYLLDSSPYETLDEAVRAIKEDVAGLLASWGLQPVPSLCAH